jgi:hypothetical protein
MAGTAARLTAAADQERSIQPDAPSSRLGRTAIVSETNARTFAIAYRSEREPASVGAPRLATASPSGILASVPERRYRTQSEKTPLIA